MYTYQCLVNQSYAEIADCLNLAFSDYALPLQMSAEQVEAFFTSSGADLRLSYGAFYGNRLIGFMVNACSIYNGERGSLMSPPGWFRSTGEKRSLPISFPLQRENCENKGLKNIIWKFSNKIRRQSMPTKSRGLRSAGHFLS